MPCDQCVNILSNKVFPSSTGGSQKQAAHCTESPRDTPATLGEGSQLSRLPQPLLSHVTEDSQKCYYAVYHTSQTGALGLLQVVPLLPK